MQLFRERLQMLLDNIELTQKKLSVRSGVSVKTIIEWKKKDSTPRASSVRKISDATKCSFQWLWKGEGEMFGKVAMARIGARILAGHNQQEQQHDISDDTTDNKLERELLEERNWKEFKELCTANFDNVFRYIAEEYSQDSIGIMNFMEDFTESLQSYNKWRSEKKRSRENIHLGSKNLAANDE